MGRRRGEWPGSVSVTREAGGMEFRAPRRRRKCRKRDAGVGSKLPAGIGCGVPSEETDDWINTQRWARG